MSHELLDITSFALRGNVEGWCYARETCSNQNVNFS